jgi:hypothetical protein
MVYLAKDETVSEKTDIGFDVRIYLDSSTRDVVAVWSYAPYGISEFSKEDAAWVAVSPADKRGVQWQNYTVYKIDWSNASDFDENNKSKTLEMYSNGNLTEDYLRKNSIFVREPAGTEVKS